MQLVIEAFSELIQGGNLLVLLLATIIGVIIGATPGLTVNMAVALAVPLTMYMPLPSSLCLLFGLYVSGIYGGSISAILINTPGTPASAATAIDGYAMTQKGQAANALRMALVASFVGGLVSIGVLIVVAQNLADFALMFGPAERTTLLLFALTMVGLLAGESMLKGLLAGTLGVLLATVGLDPMIAVPRFTFGVPDLDDGFSFIPLLIGLYAISEMLVQAEVGMRSRVGGHPRATALSTVGSLLRDFLSSWKSIIRSSFLGTFIGILPGIGATVAAFLGYSEAKRSSRNSALFGKGTVEGVAAAEAANNAVTGSTLIPLLALSIPGDTVTAILYGALLIQGVTPGPLVFQTKLHVVYLIYLSLLFANIFMLAVGFSFLSFFRRITSLPTRIVFPTVFVLCVVGSFAIRNSLFDVYVMMSFGVVGYIMRRLLMPISPLLIGFILGRPFEEAFRQALVSSEGDLGIFLFRPVAAGFLILTLISVGLTIYRRLKRGLEHHNEADIVNHERVI